MSSCKGRGTIRKTVSVVKKTRTAPGIHLQQWTIQKDSYLMTGGRMAVGWDGRAAFAEQLGLSIAVSFCSSLVAET
eukprot:652646-Hanusia_phi.AAC.1